MNDIRDRSTLFLGALAPAILLRIESAIVAALSLFLFGRGDESWWLFLAWPLPDLSFAGYLAGPRVGAALYNLVHNYFGPAILSVFGVASGSGLLVALGLVWFSHLGIDRLLGYGLKYPTAFKDTHLQRV